MADEVTYLYGNALYPMPALPEPPAPEYEFKFIYAIRTPSGEGSVYWLVMSRSVFFSYYEGSILCEAGNVGAVYYFDADAGWVDTGNDVTNNFVIENYDDIYTVWSNFDIVDADGNIHMAASEPVPVGDTGGEGGDGGGVVSSAILFDNGQTNQELTGGWDTTSFYCGANYPNNGAASVGDTMTLTTSKAYTCSAIGPVKKIDLTNCNAVIAEASEATAAFELSTALRICESADASVTVKAMTLTVGTNTLDVSDLTGEYYIVLTASGSSTIPSMTAKVTKLHMEVVGTDEGGGEDGGDTGGDDEEIVIVPVAGGPIQVKAIVKRINWPIWKQGFAMGMVEERFPKKAEQEEPEPDTSDTWLYNGIPLPALPDDVDREQYPYAAIQQNNTNTDYFTLFISAEPIYIAATENHGDAVYYPNPLAYSISEETGKWSMFRAYDFTLDQVLSYVTPVWCSHNILKENGNVYLSGSEPVPVYE